jgi:hypothetical protein
MENIDRSFHPQGSAEWHAERFRKFTSSKVNCLLVTSKTAGEPFGDGAWTYIYEKLDEWATGIIEENGFKGNDATDWGLANEPEAIGLYQIIKGYKVDLCGFETYSESFGGSPDGKVNADGIIEIKCPYVGSNHMALMDLESADQFKKFYKKYYTQIQSNLFVTQKEWCDFVSFNPRPKIELLQMKIIRIYRDEAMIKEIDQRVELATEVLTERFEYMINKNIELFNSIKKAS